MDNLNNLEAALTILSAMITPVLLTSACESLTISTANRSGRTIEWARKIAEPLETLAPPSLRENDQDRKRLFRR